MGTSAAHGPPARKGEAIKLIRNARDRGVTLFDTAESCDPILVGRVVRMSRIGAASPGQRPFCLAFFSRRGRRDLFFGANFGIFVDFLLGAIGGAAALAASGTTALAFFPAPFSAAFLPLAVSPSIVPFFLSAIPSSGPAEFPEIRIRG